ncbi:MAG: ribokinase [Treponema sp.]|jgi:ribokinase|nr:ribokinase [Treponema sp.]
MKFLVYGALNIDLIFSVDHIVIPGETEQCASLEKSSGGKGSNQAAALAKAGMSAHLAGKIGNDGAYLLDMLRSFGVNTDLVSVWEGDTGRALIQLDRNGQNAIVYYPGGNGAVVPEEIEKAIGAFGEGDMLVLQNEIPHIGLMMRKAKERGLAVCLNPSPCDEKIESLPLEMTDIFFVNEIEGASLAGMTGGGGPETILERLVGRFPASEIVLTLGKEGALYGYRNTRESGAILDYPVVDTTGAGDTFTGYFLAARARGFSVKDALALACRAASIAVSRKGALGAIPGAGEVF